MEKETSRKMGRNLMALLKARSYKSDALHNLTPLQHLHIHSEMLSFYGIMSTGFHESLY